MTLRSIGCVYSLGALGEGCCRAIQMSWLHPAQGFKWVDDLTHYGAHRWGWASTQPGDVLEIKVLAAPLSPAVRTSMYRHNRHSHCLCCKRVGF